MFVSIHLMFLVSTGFQEFQNQRLQYVVSSLQYFLQCQHWTEDISM